MDQVLHRFPNPELDRDRFNIWLYAVDGDIIGLPNEFIYKNRRVCHRHFEVKFLCRNRRLSNIAIPTLNMPDRRIPPKYNFGIRKPMQEIQNIVLESSNDNSDSSPALEDLCFTTQLSSKLPVIVPAPSTSSIIDSEKYLDVPTVPEDSSNISQLDSAMAMAEPVPSTSTHPEPLKNLVKTVQKPIIKKNKVKMFTETEKILRKRIIAVKVKLSKYKSKLKKQAAEVKAAKKFATNTAFLRTIENCSTAAKLLMQIQWRENKKKAEGRRFSLQEKIAALSILKQSPKGYRFLRKIFILPAPQTLIKLIQRSNIQPGINKNIFLQLKKRAEKMKLNEKLCVLLFDEISLKANIAYNERKGEVSGFVHNGEQKLPEFANHALVFMVRGLIHNYKQPITYSFANSATKGPQLSKQIKSVVTNLQEAGLIVVASVCDQSTNNRYAIKCLEDETRGIYLRRGEAPKDKIILINNQEIIPFYDPPHLLKGIRNNLLNKDLMYKQNGVTKFAKWQHLQRLHSENPTFEGIKLIPKLTEYHVNHDKINKMKVKYAAQIFSRAVAVNMGYLADKGILPLESKDTACWLLFMDNLFDSMNGSHAKKGNGKPLLKPVTPNSLHHETWAESVKVLKSVKFINSKGKEENVPSVKNWVWTLEAAQNLLNKLYIDFGVNSVWMRHLNQDPLENFFGVIRSHGCRNNNPTCDQFQSAFSATLINNLNSVHTQGSNCEKDYCDMLHALVIDDNNREATSTSNIDFSEILDIQCQSVVEENADPRKLAPLQYVSGYILKKTKENIFKYCGACCNTFLSEGNIEYIQYREYAGRRWLCYPSNQFLLLILNFQHIINEILKRNLEKTYLKDCIETALLTLNSFDFINCTVHKNKVINYLIHFNTKFYINNYCKNINKILSGRLENYDDEDMYQTKAKKLYYKCYKRKYK